MIRIDWQSGIPAYDQIVNGIIKLKAVGGLAVNEQLPSVRQMAIKLGVNPNTVQKAYLILEQKGIIYSVSGKGSFISDNIEADKSVEKEFLEKVEKAVSEAMKMGVDKQYILNTVHNLLEKGGNEDD